MAVLSFGEIIELKELIKPLGYIIHTHDACGAQSFNLEPVDETASEKVYDVLEQFFTKHKMKVTYYGEKKLDFVAK